MALLQVSGGFEAGEPNSESISRSAIAELIVRSSFSALRNVWGALLEAVEKSNRFGFLFVMTIGSAAAGALWIQYRYQQPARDLVGAWVEREGDWQARMQRLYDAEAAEEAEDSDDDDDDSDDNEPVAAVDVADPPSPPPVRVFTL